MIMDTCIGYYNEGPCPHCEAAKAANARPRPTMTPSRLPTFAELITLAEDDLALASMNLLDRARLN